MGASVPRSLFSTLVRRYSCLAASRSPSVIMETRITTDVGPAVAALKAGKPVGMPTETVYGLAANALDAAATGQIFAVKGRPSDNPLICHISSLDMLSQLVATDESTGKLKVPESLWPVLNKYWPGPLTVLLPKKSEVPLVTTGGLETVAVRFPRHAVAQELIRQCGFPLAAPSANLSGRPSPTTAQHVLQDLDGRIEWVVEGGPCEFGLESTVLSALEGQAPVILRPGSITPEHLRQYLPDVAVFKAQTAEDIAMMERPPTPGMKYRHYSPTAPVVLCNVARSDDEVRAYIEEQLAMGKSVVHLVPSRSNPWDIADARYSQVPLSSSGEHVEIAHRLFAALREADELKPDLIVAHEIDEKCQGEALAIMNRLSKAASQRI